MYMYVYVYLYVYVNMYVYMCVYLTAARLLPQKVFRLSQGLIVACIKAS
jgi:hypothetical protein